MDIKNSLGKIEQYWQIIRNLHFHIEQEGEISQEEYALIEKYLKIISQKYQNLIKEKPAEIIVVKEEEPLRVVTDPQSTEAKSDQIQDAFEADVNKEVELASEESPLIDIAKDTKVNFDKHQEEIFSVLEENVESFQEEFLAEENPKSVAENIAKDLVSEKPKVQSISSFLEQMLDGPDAVPETPLLFNNNQEGNKGPSVNDKLKEMKTPLEDLNSRIKKSTADKISLNDKFEYIRELFGNNPVEYSSVIQQFDTYGIGIWNNIEKEFSSKYQWGAKPGTVEKLKSIILNK
ncbi:MAG: hypothetical protein LC105_05040 [Chitinophagales bacterium]|nr:hypothetical protein [Chitinophagales bacterium]